MDDLDCTPDQKLKGAVSLLRDEAYQWWLTINEGTQADCLTCEFFKTTFQAKYGDRTVAEYEAEFLRLSRYARGMVATKYERCVQFEDGLRDGLRVLIAPQREWDFTALVDKAKITEDVTCVERQNREKDRGKRDVESSNSFQRFKRKPRGDGPIRVRTPAAATTGP
ncbi:uncharacterized protein LOC108475287 [Gossypium arboreum]|uniref:uncharacterized protein LOC108475287 n=1 Tax=Gossypium arboreum TaxID=29729 RepID=UPI000818FC12|nr:uncharacterized protein LOC108475287 [Gossypium arboreum]